MTTVSAAASTSRGALAERQAEQHLNAHGLKTIERNYGCRLGEIDLVMLDGETLVFAEVRYRASARYGSPGETIDSKKRMKIMKCAEHYLMATQKYRNSTCRFDVVLLCGPLSTASIEWIMDAFQA